MIRDRLKSLDEIEGRLAADLRKAYEAIDQILDIRQQAKFRVFEENMERRKLELVTAGPPGESPEAVRRAALAFAVVATLVSTNSRRRRAWRYARPFAVTPSS